MHIKCSNNNVLGFFLGGGVGEIVQRDRRKRDFMMQYVVGITTLMSNVVIYIGLLYISCNCFSFF